MKPQPSNNDEAAILRSARHDLNLFAPLYERYVDRIYAYCLRRVNSASDAEDLTSLIFTRAMNGIHDYRGGSVAAWLFRIAHNTVVNHYRDKKPQLPLPDDVDEAFESTLIDDLLSAEEQRTAIRLVSTLPPESQNLIWLRVNGLNSSEIGEVVGKSAGAVRTELYRLFKNLRAQFVRELER
ncbi:MAG TPA: RNA polymerase sigma factor [Oceanobacillus sp.]|nr:RNA polymerase sigma factor [Oceanobacillus sp.]